MNLGAGIVVSFDWASREILVLDPGRSRLFLRRESGDEETRHKENQSSRELVKWLAAADAEVTCWAEENEICAQSL